MLTCENSATNNEDEQLIFEREKPNIDTYELFKSSKEQSFPSIWQDLVENDLIL